MFDATDNTPYERITSYHGGGAEICARFSIVRLGSPVWKEFQHMKPKLADDLLGCAAAIAAHRGEPERRTIYLLQRGLIPGFKVGRYWNSTKTAQDADVERREREAENQWLEAQNESRTA